MDEYIIVVQLKLVEHAGREPAQVLPLHPH